MKTRYFTYLCLALICLASCSKHEVVKEIEEIKASDDPMRFSTSESDYEQTPTKSLPLTDGFMVSTYKAFGAAGQQTVMGEYQVIYKTDPWYNSSQWGYVGSTGQFYQNQYEKYWDYANFPYRFHALSPAPVQGSSKISGFELSASALKIPSSVEFKMQKVSNDGSGVIVTPASDASAKPEPYIVAQVHRQADGKDVDVITGNEINKNSTSRNRSVAVPFHHLTSKVRFAIYTTDQGTYAAPMPVTDFRVRVISSGFVTSAKGYTATLSSTSNMLDGSFNSRVSASSPGTLLVDSGSTGLVDNDILDCRQKSDACFFGSKNGLLQIPQDNVKMEVSFNIAGRPYSYTLSVEHNELFNWKANELYTYYIIVSSLSPIQVEFTATLEPWEDVNGSLSTDIEK